MLEDLYFKQNMTQDEMGRHFGYLDRQPIMRLFKKFEIVAKSKKEIAKRVFERKHETPTKEELKGKLNTLSASKIAKHYGVSRGMVGKWMNEYSLKTTYFSNADVKDKITDEKYADYSPKEIAIELKTSIGVVKQYKQNFTEKKYDRECVINKIAKYGYDLNNKGLVKQIEYDDANLYKSIYELTKDHITQTDKLTERLYRIFNNFNADEVKHCRFCGKVLNFFTIKQGYGYSGNEICKDCIPNHCGFGVSSVSQELFNSIYSALSDKDKMACRYHDCGGELIIKVTPKDHVILAEHIEYTNKNNYHIDFELNNKIIEFDGSYYHQEPKKEIAKDAFLNLKGYEVLHITDTDYYKNKDETIQRCLTFLNR